MPFLARGVGLRKYFVLLFVDIKRTNDISNLRFCCQLQNTNKVWCEPRLYVVFMNGLCPKLVLRKKCAKEVFAVSFALVAREALACGPWRPRASHFESQSAARAPFVTFVTILRADWLVGGGRVARAQPSSTACAVLCCFILQCTRLTSIKNESLMWVVIFNYHRPVRSWHSPFVKFLSCWKINVHEICLNPFI